MSGRVQLETAAYVKVVAHARRHAQRSVLGVLLGDESLLTSSSASTATVVVRDAVPLFHLPPLLPTLDVAFNLVHQYAHTTYVPYCDVSSCHMMSLT